MLKMAIDRNKNCIVHYMCVCWVVMVKSEHIGCSVSWEYIYMCFMQDCAPFLGWDYPFYRGDAAEISLEYRRAIVAINYKLCLRFLVKINYNLLIPLFRESESTSEANCSIHIGASSWHVNCELISCICIIVFSEW